MCVCLWVSIRQFDYEISAGKWAWLYVETTATTAGVILFSVCNYFFDIGPKPSIQVVVCVCATNGLKSRPSYCKLPNRNVILTEILESTTQEELPSIFEGYFKWPCCKKNQMRRLFTSFSFFWQINWILYRNVSVCTFSAWCLYKFSLFFFLFYFILFKAIEKIIRLITTQQNIIFLLFFFSAARYSNVFCVRKMRQKRYIWYFVLYLIGAFVF